MGAANMNHVEAGKVVVEFRKVICAAVAKAGKKYGRNMTPADVDDLASVATIVLLERALPAYNGSIGLRSYVWMISDREARKVLVKARAETVYNATETGSGDPGSDDYAGHVEATDASSVEMRAAASIECHRLRSAIDALTEPERDLVEAMASDTCPAYAAAYGLTPVQMTRAKARIRAKLA